MLLLACMFYVAPPHYEIEIVKRISHKYDIPEGGIEHRLWDDTRVDMLSAEFAWEVDKTKNWQDAVGQSLYYSLVTNRKPGIILLTSDTKKDASHIHRCQCVCAKYGIRLEIEVIK